MNVKMLYFDLIYIQPTSLETFLNKKFCFKASDNKNSNEKRKL